MAGGHVDDTRRILFEIQKDMGKVLQGLENNNEFIKAVNDKADKIREEAEGHRRDDEAHKNDTEAHGIGIAIKTAKIIGSTAVGLLAAFEAFMHVGGRH